MFHERLRIVRKSKGYTQEDLAKIVRTKKATISNYETGYSSPSNEMLKDLADVLGTTTDYLLGRTNNPYFLKIEDTHRTVDYMDDFPEEARETLEEYKQFLREKYGKQKGKQKA